MTIPREELAKVVERVWKRSKECSMCLTETSWILGSMMELRAFHGGALTEGCSVTPVIPLTCPHCGYTHLLSAVTLGLIDRETGKRVKR